MYCVKRQVTRGFSAESEGMATIVESSGASIDRTIYVLINGGVVCFGYVYQTVELALSQLE